MKPWIGLHIFFVLAVQFAPTLHDAFPHEENESSCAHSTGTEHFEKAEDVHPSSPCYFCVHAGNPVAPLIPIGHLPEAPVLLRTPIVPGENLLDEPLFLPTASRGPPSGL
jgi:hypothetical protein